MTTIISSPGSHDIALFQTEFIFSFNALIFSKIFTFSLNHGCWPSLVINGNLWINCQIFIRISRAHLTYIFSNSLDIYRVLSLPLFPAAGLSIFILDRSLYLNIQVGGENGHLFHLLFLYFFNWGTWHRITSNRIHFFIWCSNNFKFSSFSWHRGCWLPCSKADGASPWWLTYLERASQRGLCH